MSLYSVSTVQKNSCVSALVRVPYVSLQSDRVILYKATENQNFNRGKHRNSLANLEKHKTSGVISSASAKYIRRVLDTWLNSIIVYNNQFATGSSMRVHYPVFITLTLCAEQFHDDNYIKRYMLEPFLNKLREVSGARYTFWRAEAQGNGNIHFHILSDRYICKSLVSSIWISILRKEGYLKKFELKFSHSMPPCTHIKSANSVKDFVRYVLKYCSKPAEGRLLQGRLWGMSDALREIKPCTLVLDSVLSSELNSLVNTGNVRVFSDEWFSIVLMRKGYIIDLSDTTICLEYKKFALAIYDFLYNGVIYEPIVEPTPLPVAHSVKKNEKPVNYSIFDVYPDYCPPIRELTNNGQWSI